MSVSERKIYRGLGNENTDADKNKKLIYKKLLIFKSPPFVNLKIVNIAFKRTDFQL